MSETPPNPYDPGKPPYAAPYAFGAPEHPQANTVLVLGILGLVVCGVLAPFAWVMGNRVVAEIDASRGAVGGRSSANTGRILGIIGSVLIGLGLLIVVGIFVLFVVVGATAFSTST